MSDGLSDASAVGRIGDKLEAVAYDLKLAIKAAKQGHRGLTVNIESTVNDVLRGCGYEIRKVQG